LPVGEERSPIPGALADEHSSDDGLGSCSDASSEDVRSVAALLDKPPAAVIAGDSPGAPCEVPVASGVPAVLDGPAEPEPAVAEPAQAASVVDDAPGHVPSAEHHESLDQAAVSGGPAVGSGFQLDTLAPPSRSAICSDDREVDEIPTAAELLASLGENDEDDEIISLDELEEEGDPNLYDGCWADDTGRPVATIRGLEIHWWPDTKQTFRIVMDKLIIEGFAGTDEGQLNSKGQLLWDDGDIWTRMQAPAWACTTSGAEGTVASADAKAKGKAAFLEHQYAEAAEQLTKAGTLDPTDEVSQQLLELSNLCAWEEEGIPVMRLGSYEAAVKLVQNFKKRGGDAKARGIKAFHASDFGEAIIHLSEALALDASDTITQRLLEYSKMREWEAQGIPVFRLGDYKAAVRLVEQCDLVESMSMTKLKEWYVTFFPEERNMKRDEIAKLWKLVKVWQTLPLPELIRECQERSVPIPRGCPGTKELQRQLSKLLLLQERMDAWDARGLEAKRVGDPITMIQLIQEYEHVDTLSMEELMEWYKRMGFPVERDMEQSELVQLSKKVTFWQALSLAELRKEFRAKGIIIGASAAHTANEAQQTTELTFKLVIHDRMETWEARGYQAKRIGDPDEVIRVIEQHEEIDRLGLEALQEWYESLHFPKEKDLGRDDIVGLYKLVIVWQALPLAELRKECEDKGLQVGGTEEPEEEQQRRLQLLNKLFLYERLDAWEAKGFQARRIGNPDAVVQLIQVCDGISKMSLEELKEWYLGLDLPDESDMDKDELVYLCWQVNLWQALPPEELEKECTSKRIAIARNHADTDQHRISMIDALLIQERINAWDARGFQAKRMGSVDDAIQAVRVYENLLSMGDAELRQEYADLGLPDGAGLEREEMLRTMKTLLIWELLPLRELMRVCRERGLSTHAGLPMRSVAQRRRDLVQRLKLDMRVDTALYGQDAATSLGPQEVPTMGPPENTVALPVSSEGTLACESVRAATAEAEAAGDSMERNVGDGGGALGSWGTQFLAWAGANSKHDPALMSRLVVKLQTEDLTLDDMPDLDSPLLDHFWGEIGFASRECRQLEAALMEYREQGLVPVNSTDHVASDSIMTDSGEQRCWPSSAGGSVETARPAIFQTGGETGASGSMEWHGGTDSAPEKLAGDPGAAKLLAWARAARRAEVELLLRLVEKLQEEDFYVDDMPKSNFLECKDFLEELGFSCAESPQLQDALQAFEARLSSVEASPVDPTHDSFHASESGLPGTTTTTTESSSYTQSPSAALVGEE